MLVGKALIEAEVIIAPAPHVKATREKMKQHECFEQRLNHKKR